MAAVEAARARAQKAQSDYRRAIILEEEKESIIGEISREYKKQKAGENEKSGRFERGNCLSLSQSTPLPHGLISSAR